MKHHVFRDLRGLRLLFSRRAQKAMQLAHQESLWLNHESIDTEHILLGLIRDGNGVTPGMLSKVDRDLSNVRAEVYRLVTKGSDNPPLHILSLTPLAKQVVEHAEQEARDASHPRIEAEHLLLGLMQEPEGIAYQVLKGIGLDLDELRSEVQDILRDTYD